MIALCLAMVLAAADVPVVSVLYFDNESNDPELEFMRKGLADLLITDLVAWEGVQVVERTRLEDVLKELKFQQTKYVDKASAAKLGKVLNATHLIYGSMVVSGPKLVLQARLVRASDGAVIIAVKEQDDRDKIFELEQRLVNQLVAQIDARLSANAQARKRAKVPDLATVIAFGRALDLSDQGKIDEAQAAMRAVVSKSPTFLLGRERQTEFLKNFEEYQKRKRDLIVGAIVDLGKVIDDTLKNEANFDTLDEEDTERFLSMRMLKGRFLARVLKQFLGTHSTSLRTVLPGKEGKALLAMRDWVENQRKYIAESDRAGRRFATSLGGVSRPFRARFRATDLQTRLMTDAKIGDLSLGSIPILTLAEFVHRGDLNDGERFSVAPVLAAVDQKEGKAVMDELERAIAAELARAKAGVSTEYDPTNMIEFLSELALSKGDVDAAVVADQRILDAFPTGSRAARLEAEIKTLLTGGHMPVLQIFKVWEKARTTCDDMAINMSSGMTPAYLRAQGLQGLDALAKDLETACKPSNKTRMGFTFFYQHLSHAAAEAEDCERYRAFSRRYLELGGSVADMLAHAKNRPWCDLGTLKDDLTWLKGTYDDGTRDFVMERRPNSVLSTDKKVLSINGGHEGFDRQSFSLRLERQPNGGFKCTSAQWSRDAQFLEGTCTVTLTSQAPEDAPGFDVGTFEASFVNPRPFIIKAGEFKVRREH